MSAILKIIQPKFNLKKLNKSEELINTIVGEAIKYSHLVDPKSNELLIYIGNLVENLIVEKFKLINEDVIISIYKRLYPNVSDEEIIYIKTQLEFLKSSKLIRKISSRAFIGHYVRIFFTNIVPKLF